MQGLPSDAQAARCVRATGGKCLPTAGFSSEATGRSHIVMVKEGVAVTLSVPDHRELKPGTLRSLVRRSGLTVGEFLVLLGR